MKTVPFVRVFETPEGWHVGVRGGHYADEKTREAAIEDARQLAREIHSEEIDIYDLEGKLVERLPVKEPARLLRHLSPRRRQ
jgi:hypothetical protein